MEDQINSYGIIKNIDSYFSGVIGFLFWVKLTNMNVFTQIVYVPS